MYFAILALGMSLAPVWLFFLFTLAGFQILGRKKLIREDFQLHWLLATVVTGGMMIAFTLVESAVDRLTPAFALGAWILVDAIAGAIILKAEKQIFSRLIDGIKLSLIRWKTLDPATKSLLIGTTIFLLLLGFFAAVTPTVVWDSHTYHMPRIMHWLQQRSLADYPTNIPRQLEYPPGAEMMIAQLMLLSGNDLPANLPQWWALVTSAIAAAFITRELLSLLSPRYPVNATTCAAFAALIVIITPGAGYEAISSLNDVLAGLWCMIAIALGLLVLREPGNHLYHIGAAASIALGICTKHSTFIYLAPFVFLIGLVFLRRKAFSPLLRLAGIILLFSAALNANWMHKNYARMGHALISNEALSANSNRAITPPQIAANIIRNLSFYTRTPFDSMTAGANAVLQLLGDATGETMDDPKWVFGHQHFRFAASSLVSDGSAWGNIYMPLLLLIACAAFFWRCKINSALGVYLLAVTLSFLFFCAYLRWDPWHTRLEFVYFFLAAPFIAAVISGWFRGGLLITVAFFLLLNALVAITGDVNLPTIPAILGREAREKLYFVASPELAAPTLALADDIVKSRCSNVLLKIGDDTWEYPLWVSLKNRGFKGTIQHVLTKDSPSEADIAAFRKPDSVLLTMHASPASLPPDYSFIIGYDFWKAYHKAEMPEVRARMIAGQAVLRYAFARPGEMTLHFEPRDAAGKQMDKARLSMTVVWVETNGFDIVGNFKTNLPANSSVNVSCPVQSPSATVFISNLDPTDPVDYLSKVNLTKKDGK